MRKKLTGNLICMLLIIGTLIIISRTMSIANTTNVSYCYSMQYGCTTLISDNHHIIEVNYTGEIVWDYIIGTVDSERLSNGNTLLGGSILVKEINFLGIIVWQYATGLLVVSDVERLDNGNTLITDFGNNFVIEINSTGSIVWEILGLSLPMDAERLANGNTLICGGGCTLFRIFPIGAYFFEVTSEKKIIWRYINPYPIPPLNGIMKFEYYPPDYPGLGDFNKNLS